MRLRRLFELMKVEARGRVYTRYVQPAVGLRLRKAEATDALHPNRPRTIGSSPAGGGGGQYRGPYQSETESEWPPKEEARDSSPPLQVRTTFMLVLSIYVPGATHALTSNYVYGYVLEP